MKRPFIAPLTIFSSLAAGLAILSSHSQVAAADPTTASKPSPSLKYPMATRGDHVDVYHGVKVPDPYRWLEDADSPATKAWVVEQNKITQAFLGDIPQRDALRQRLTKVWNFERFSAPTKRGSRYFFSHNTGLLNQSILMVADSPTDAGHVLLDPNKLSEDGTVSLAGMAVSEDGKILAYGLSHAGSDWRDYHFRDVATGKDLPDVLKWIRYASVSWTPDGKGLYYSRYDEPKAGAELTGTNYFQKLYYHQLGTEQSADKLIYERKDQKEWRFHGDVTEDGRYLLIYVSDGSPNNQLFIKDLSKADAPIVELITGFDAQFWAVTNTDKKLTIVTDWKAPRKRVMEIDLAAPARDKWKELIAEQPDAVEGVNRVGDRLVITSLHDASSRVRLFDLAGKAAGEVALPGIGTAGGFDGRNDSTETFYTFTSFSTPGTIYRYDLASGKSTIFRQPKVAIDGSNIVTEQVFFTSRDGTRVPMFVVHKKGIELNGNNPTLLYGYGGFDVSLTPAFSLTVATWVEMGGVYAVPSLRGGGEYGRVWHEAGMKEKKQNVFDDFLAAAEWLIAKKYTQPSKLAINGGSNGGLLVGAVMTQRPELFGAAIPAVGVMDMLRFHKFTIGFAWVSEYGSSEDAAQFKVLHAYSPLHNLKPGVKYPPTMVMTADHDDRVVPAHSFKFAAELQHVQSGPAPTLIRIQTRAGHGAGTPTKMMIEESADKLAFLAKVFGMEVPAGWKE